MSERKPSEPSDMFTHMPLPYIVRLRQTSDDDAAPIRCELKLNAYSVMEAVVQATLQVGGTGVNEGKVQVEEVMPDTEAYAEVFGRLLLARTRQ